MGRLRDPRSRSPGLAANRMAMCELTYSSSGKQKPSTDTTIQAAAVPPQRSNGSRRRRAAPLAGFAAGAAVDNAVAADGSGAPEVELAELTELEGSDELTDSVVMHTYTSRTALVSARRMYSAS
eukprot:570119-Pleurochrysis_carterae.AAC.3